MKATLKKDQQKEIRYLSELYPIMQSILMRESKLRRNIEHFWVASLSHKHILLNVELINLGSVSRVHVEPPEVFRIPIYKAATKIILVHNHPSGVLTPSAADKNHTDRMIKVGKLLNIEVCDHQIISESAYYSFAQAGLLDQLKKSGLYEITDKETEDMKKWREEELAKKAEDKAKREIAVRSIQLGLSVADVVKITGLRKSSVEKLKRELG